MKRAIRVLAIGSIFTVLGATATTPIARAQAVGEPEVSGDQLIFIFDARQNRNAFLSVTSSSDDPMFVDVAFYSASIGLLARETIELTSGQNRVIDATSFAGGAANGNAGLAVMTPLLADGQPSARGAHGAADGRLHARKPAAPLGNRREPVRPVRGGRLRRPGRGGQRRRR
ncbi:MAG: hypothetical protein FJ144_12860 [Deltaproteobacteria bacterium]|nr:hypothetical protein [Deltaproteobacteria bacterium]